MRLGAALGLRLTFRLAEIELIQPTLLVSALAKGFEEAVPGETEHDGEGSRECCAHGQDERADEDPSRGGRVAGELVELSLCARVSDEFWKATERWWAATSPLGG